eukprot:TRINITY_DN3006_c0_g1_i1.p1 TRINITY_DN3006_c0_g1~~TRINITY_DN3006_c0_g1_i1.p1  ORF type:complete len:203 (+),score=30.05 TRINITY_DN3006_c0_g1_i1:108-716(+)
MSGHAAPRTGTACSWLRSCRPGDPAKTPGRAPQLQCSPLPELGPTSTSARGSPPPLVGISQVQVDGVFPGATWSSVSDWADLRTESPDLTVSVPYSAPEEEDAGPASTTSSSRPADGVMYFAPEHTKWERPTAGPGVIMMSDVTDVDSLLGGTDSSSQISSTLLDEDLGQFADAAVSSASYSYGPSAGHTSVSGSDCYNRVG